MTKELKVEELENEIIDDEQEDLQFSEGFDDSIGEPSIEDIAEVVAQHPSLSEDQVRELFEHNNQRIYGKFGEVQREVKRLEALAQQSMQYREQPSAPREFTADSFSNMREEFGDDFAQALARDLSKLPLQSQQGINQQQIDLIVSQKMDQLKNDFEIKDVARQHPDWKDVANSDDFQGWKSQLPAEVQDRLNNSWDASFVSASITAYKRDKDLHQQSLKAEASARQKETNKKQRLLENAVMPRSSGGSSDDYDDDFEAGFNGD